VEAVIHLDTHVVVWLFTGEIKRIVPGARRLIEQNAIAVSPMVLLELEFLREIGRTQTPSSEIFAALSSTIGLSLADAPLSRVVAAATRHPWTRDPFDRMIVGAAATRGERLLTADRTIRKHFTDAVWG
jgi:PIN domain nuclease of toxin-antitoxin system